MFIRFRAVRRSEEPRRLCHEDRQLKRVTAVQQYRKAIESIQSRTEEKKVKVPTRPSRAESGRGLELWPATRLPGQARPRDLT